MGIVLNDRCYSDVDEISVTEDNIDVVSFLTEWFDDREYVVGHTSGSTGTPKKIHLLKSDMEASARLTNEFFGIDTNSVLLLCLSPNYIAGKMMIVRALLAGANLLVVKPSSSPLKEINRSVDFAAMVPMQVQESLSDSITRNKISYIKQLIIGGAAVSSTLESALSAFPIRCFSTYGMTETVSHIALRELNTAYSGYKALGNITFSQDDRGCLCIHAPHLSNTFFITNDIVRLSGKTSFEWLGRFDNVINSGGVKHFPEEIEKKISELIPDKRFYVTGVLDGRLGEKAVLIIEDQNWTQEKIASFMKEVRFILSPYQIPKQIRFVSNFRETYSGKIIRENQE